METSSSLMLSVLMLVSFRVIFSDIPVERFGCYFRKDRINITCNQDTRFAFQELAYGFPVGNCTETNTNVTCSRDGNECLITDKFWSFMRDDGAKKCSGGRECNIQTTWETNDGQCQNASQNACYLIVKGTCIYEENKIDFCEEKKVDGSKIYLRNPGFPAFDTTGDEYECDCTVESGETLQLEALVLTLDFKATNTCSSELTIYNENDNLTLTCDSRMFHQPLNISDSSRINLKLIKGQHHDMYQIWLKINSVNNEKVTVECNKRKHDRNHSTTERNTVRTTTGKSLREIISLAESKKIEDFMLGVKIAAGVVGGLILIALASATILTYRRYANI